MTIKRTEELEPGDVIQVAGRWRTLVTRTSAAGSDGDWDLELDPPPVEIPPGPLRRRGSEKWFLREDARENPYLPATDREILEQEGPGGPGGVGFRANTGRRAGRSSARVYGFGDFTFEYNSLTGDVTVTGVVIVEPLEPGKVRLSSKRRGGTTGVKV